MPEKIPAKPFREKIVDALAAKAGIMRKPSHLPVVDHEMRMVALVAREDLSARIGKANADHTEVGMLGSPVALTTDASASPPASKQI